MPELIAPDSGPLWRPFARFLAPLVVGNVLQVLSGTLNSLFIGQLLGTQALAAASAVLPMVYFFNALVIGIGSGGSVLVGQAWGARDLAKVRAIAGTLVVFGVIVGLVIALLGGLQAERLLRLLGTPPDVLADATAYARLMMFAMPGLLGSILVMQLLRGMGDTTTPLRALLLSNLIACVVTPAFIRGWLGLPQLGVASAALATLLSVVAAFGYVGWRMRRTGHPLAPGRALLPALRIDRRVLWVVVKLGVPLGLQMVATTLAQLALVSLVNRFGSDATAAYGAVYQLMNYAQFPALSIGIATSILGAQAIGAGRAAQLGAITRTGLQMNLLVTGSLVALGYLFADRLLSMFITKPEVTALAASLLRMILWSCAVHGFASVLSGSMRASGTVLLPTALSVLCIVVIQVPSAYALSNAVGLKGVWMAYPIAFMAMLGLQALCYAWTRRSRNMRPLLI